MSAFMRGVKSLTVARSSSFIVQLNNLHLKVQGKFYVTYENYAFALSYQNELYVFA